MLRILLAAVTAVLVGAVGGWAVLTFLPVKAAPRPIAATTAHARAADDVADIADTKPPAPAAPPDTPPRVAAKAPPTVPEPTPRAPSAAQAQDKPSEDKPASDGAYRLKLEDGGEVSFDPGRERIRTPFGNLDLKL
jgi:type IV secretory pathway VirB10-like protein